MQPYNNPFLIRDAMPNQAKPKTDKTNKVIKVSKSQKTNKTKYKLIMPIRLISQILKYNKVYKILEKRMFAELDYGSEKLKVEIPDKNLLHVISSRHLKAVADPQSAILNGLKDPIGSVSLSEKIKGKKNVCIVISDSTRAVPTQLILEVLLAEIESCGIKKNDITILVATGLHRPNLGKELEGLVGKRIAGHTG